MKYGREIIKRIHQVTFLADILEGNELTIEEIFDRWSRSPVTKDEPFNISKWKRLRLAIEELYGVDVICNRSQRTYSIESLGSFSHNRSLNILLDRINDTFFLSRGKRISSLG